MFNWYEDSLLAFLQSQLIWSVWTHVIWLVLAFRITTNTSYLTDSYISFTLKLESPQIFCSNRSIRSSMYGEMNISDFPPCRKMVILLLKTSK